MKSTASFGASLFLALTVALGSAAEADTTTQIPFLENVGQIEDEQVAYYAKLASGSVFVTKDGEVVYALRCPRRETEASSESEEPARWAFRESFAGSVLLSPAGADASAVMVSHFKGPRCESWHSRLPAFDRVELGEVAPGIRAELHARGENVEKVIFVSPGADPSALHILVEGVGELRVDEAGRLVMRTDVGEITFTAPFAYQMIDGERRPVDVGYVLAEDGYGFVLGEYRGDHEVVIDPLLASTFLGGHNPSPPGNYDDDIVHALSAIGGLVYVAGQTQSPDFPVYLGYDETLADNFPDGFVALMTGDLSTIIAATFIGTVSTDIVHDLVIDTMGSVVITGTGGWGFPVTPGAYTHGGTTPTGGGFISRLSPDLSILETSAIPTPSNGPRAIALADGSFFFGGSTNNPSFPVTPGAWRTVCCPPGGFGIRPSEGFAGRISFDLSTLEAMTYLGGNAVTGIAVASDGTVFLTDGFDHAITGSLARFDPDFTSRLAYKSYYPGSTSGSSRTYFNDLVIDGTTVIVVGETYMNDLPTTPGVFDPTCGTDGICDGVGPLQVPRSDGFIARYSLDLQSTVALTYLGGSYFESIRAVELAPDGSILVAGETASADFPTTDLAFDTGCGVDGGCDPTGAYPTPTKDVFLHRLSADLSRLEYGTYLGGSGEEMVLALTVDYDGSVFVGGQTRSSDFPTTAGAFDRTYNGGTSDAFLSKFDTSTRFRPGLGTSRSGGSSAPPQRR